MRRGRAWAVGLLLGSLALWTWSAAHLPAPAPRSLPERLLGPVADLAAAAEWVRADLAWTRGRTDLYDLRAQRALRLAPGDPNGWAYYAHHLVYDRGSPTLGDKAEREVWVRAGISVLERGERETRRPGKLAFQLGIVYLSLAQVDDEDRPLPLSRAQAWRAAAAAFDRAAAYGEPVAAEAADAARDAADEADTK